MKENNLWKRLLALGYSIDTLFLVVEERWRLLSFAFELAWIDIYFTSWTRLNLLMLSPHNSSCSYLIFLRLTITLTDKWSSKGVLSYLIEGYHFVFFLELKPIFCFEDFDFCIWLDLGYLRNKEGKCIIVCESIYSWRCTFCFQ